MNDDLISRQAAIETILGCCTSDCDNEYECGYDDGLRQGVFRLKHLPPAQPERKDLDKITESHRQIGYEKGFQDGYAQAIEDVEMEEWKEDES